MSPTPERPASDLADALRCEIKFPLRGTPVTKVLATVERHAEVWREVYPPRVVHNAYFDTPALHAYRVSASGASRRYKVRLRWYDGELTRDPVLQWKWRQDRFNWKTIVPVELPDEVPPGTALRRLLIEQLDGGQRESLFKNPVLTVCNRYRRRYFANHDRTCRLTIDERHASSVFPRHVASRHGFTTHHRLVIVELKAAVEARERLERIMASLPWRAKRHSKYGHALSIYTQGFAG